MVIRVVLIATLAWFVGAGGWAVGEAMADQSGSLIDAAKQEKEVIIWHNGPLGSKVLDPFKAKYPFIKVKTWRANSSPIIAKATEEAKVGMHSADLILFGRRYMNILLKAGLLGEYSWRNAKGWVAQPDHNFYAAFTQSGMVPVFNAKVIPKNEWPRTWDDLTNPKWKGRTLASSSGSDAPLRTAYLWRKNDRELNWDRSIKYWRDVIRATKPKVARGFAGPTERLASGASALMIWNTTNTTLRAIAKGAPLRMLPVKKMVAVPAVLAIFKQAPHPNAARLLADFLTSPEGVILYANARQVLPLSPKLVKLSTAMKQLGERGIKVESLPDEFGTEENVRKARKLWFSELGVKARRGKKKKK